MAAEAGELVGEGLDLRVECLVLALEQHRNLTKHVSITDRIEAKHTHTTSSRRACEARSFRVSPTTNGAGDRAKRPTSVLPSRKSCSSLIVSRTRRSSASRHRHAKRPRSRRLA